MKLLDRLPVYRVSARFQGVRDDLYARHQLNTGGVTLYRGALKITEELNRDIDYFCSTDHLVDIDIAFTICGEMELAYKCWKDVIDCLYAEDCVEKENLNNLISVLKEHIGLVDNYIDVYDEAIFTRRFAPGLRGKFKLIQDEVIVQLLDILNKLM